MQTWRRAPLNCRLLSNVVKFTKLKFPIIDQIRTWNGTFYKIYARNFHHKLTSWYNLYKFFIYHHRLFNVQRGQRISQILSVRANVVIVYHNEKRIHSLLSRSEFNADQYKISTQCGKLLTWEFLKLTICHIELPL